ncbi:MAG: DNA-binding protein WhiA [Candidatus Riflebacteria bacterium]|nr:DNA-binding protein WhiA [Candidatus Riflebacteria bacterium]
MYNKRTKYDLLTTVGLLKMSCCVQSFLTGLLKGSRLRLFAKCSGRIKRPLFRIIRGLKSDSLVELTLRGKKIYVRGLDMLLLRKRFVERVGKNSILKNRKHCLIAFIQGMFISCGYIQNPEQGYHLEFRVRGRWNCAAFRYVSRALNLKFGSYDTNGLTCFYMKNSRRILRFLNLVGLFDKAAEVSELMSARNLVSMVNRQVNFETANINKSISAAEQCIANIKALLGLENQSFWTESLYLMAITRIKYPHDGIENLGKRFSPVLTKSAVNHRLRRINCLYTEYFKKNTEEISKKKD